MAPRPKPDRGPIHWGPPLWAALTPDQRDAVRERFGLPPGWSPSRTDRGDVERTLEGLSELARVMRWPPGIIGQLRQDLIDRIEREEGE